MTGGARDRRQGGLPSHPPKRTNGADRHSAHSGTTQQGAQQPADTENPRETNAESQGKRTQRPVQKTSSILFAGLHKNLHINLK